MVYATCYCPISKIETLNNLGFAGKNNSYVVNEKLLIFNIYFIYNFCV